VVIALLLARFLRTGGIAMLRMMDMPSEHVVLHGSSVEHEPVPPP
jgi:hypothetical protein